MKARELIHDGYYLVNGRPYQYSCVRNEMMSSESNLTVLTDHRQEIYCRGRYHNQPTCMTVEPMALEGDFAVNGIRIQYVHEYQMAMRAMGMQESLIVDRVWKRQ